MLLVLQLLKIVNLAAADYYWEALFNVIKFNKSGITNHYLYLI